MDKAIKRKCSLDLEKIRQRREVLRLTMQEAGILAGLGGKQNWYRIESGALANPGLQSVYGIASTLGMRIDDLILVEKREDTVPTKTKRK